MTDPERLRIKLSLPRTDFVLNVDLSLAIDGITVLFGPSGSGKTTLLRCVAGLEKAIGVVSLGESTWQDSSRRRFKPTWQRELGYVFQEASLFEHLSIRQNLLFGLRRTRQAGDTRALGPALELLGISHLLDRNVASLSGGERQRVAIARALVTRPKLLLLDEPLASLDVARRLEVMPWLERMRDELRLPILYVTHSVDELARLANDVVMLDRGSVAASGPVKETMTSSSVSLAIGDEAGLVTTGEIIALSPEDHMAQVRVGAVSIWVRDQGVSVGQTLRVRILARDVSLALSEHGDSTIQNRLRGLVESVQDDAHPSQAIVRVRCGGELILSRVTRRALRNLGITPGSTVWCQVKSVALIV